MSLNSPGLNRFLIQGGCHADGFSMVPVVVDMRELHDMRELQLDSALKQPPATPIFLSTIHVGQLHTTWSCVEPLNLDSGTGKSVYLCRNVAAHNPLLSRSWF